MSNVVPIPRNAPDLDALAGQINTAFKLGDNARITAGRLLLEAREHVPEGEWEAWIKGNVKRSSRDCREVMRIASDKDPKAALEESRAKARERQHRHLDRLRAGVRDADPTEGMEPSNLDSWEEKTYPEKIEAWLSVYENFTPSQRKLAKQAYFARYLRYEN